MFDIGFQELVLIFVIALIVFGPKNLPDLGRRLGRAMREFRRASDEFRSTIETNLKINEPDPVPEPAPAPVAAQSEASATATVEALPDSVLDPYAPAPAGPPAGEPYLAQRGARLFHGRDCAWVNRIPEAERLYFKKVAEAKDAGFAACPVCEPWEPG
jgi:Tat protein translocase TatB subunit